MRRIDHALVQGDALLQVPGRAGSTSFVFETPSTVDDTRLLIHFGLEDDQVAQVELSLDGTAETTGSDAAVHLHGQTSTLTSS